MYLGSLKLENQVLLLSTETLIFHEHIFFICMMQQMGFSCKNGTVGLKALLKMEGIYCLHVENCRTVKLIFILDIKNFSVILVPIFSFYPKLAVLVRMRVFFQDLHSYKFE